MSSAHDTKGNIRTRRFLSFILCILLAALSGSICTRVVFVNPDYIANKLSAYTYVSAYRQTVLDYATDLFVKNGIPADNLETVISQEAAEPIAAAYINSVIQARTGFTAETVAQAVESLETAIAAEIETQLQGTAYTCDVQTAQALAGHVGEYALERISIAHDTYLETLTNVGMLASLVLCIVLAVFCAILALILFFVGAKRYRSVRAIGVSCTSAGLFDVFLALIAILILQIKQINIYPLYLREALMSYLYGAIGAVAIAGGILLLLALLVTTVVWKMKRDE